MSLSYRQRNALAKRADTAARGYDREAAELAAAKRAEQREAVEEARRARVVADASCPRDIGNLRPGDGVRDAHGWHRVVKVNAKSVTVATPWSWTDTIRLERIIETRQVVRP